MVNKVIAMYLRCVMGDRPRAWVDWLSWAEYCYNTSFHTALRATPFEVVYGRPPPPMLPYTPGTGVRKLLMLFYDPRMRSWQRFANVFCRPSSCPRGIMMQGIAMWSSKWVIGYGCGCCTARRNPSSREPRASSVPATQGRSAS